MDNLFFCVNEDFEKIIGKHFNKKCNIQRIKTGWTNYVFRVIVKKRTYYFRFPRNDFFSEALVKEVSFCNFLRKQKKVKVPKLNLFYFENKPYSMHKSVAGESLDNVFEKLSNKQKNKIAYDICKYIEKLQKISIKTRNFEQISSFLSRLSKVCEDEYDLSKHKFLEELEKKKLVLCHGDLNPGNIIIKNGKFVGVVDYAFGGVSSEFCDIVRLIGRMPNSFENCLKSTFEKMFKKTLESETIKELQNVWEYVEAKYIEYIRKNHKDIVLPNLI